MKKITLFLVFVFATITGSYGQAGGYSFSELTETYTAVTGTASTATGDDGIQDGIAIGFTFKYDGVDYTNFSITTNGFIKLGTATTTITTGIANYTNAFSNAVTNRPMIAAFWDDNHRNTGSIQYVMSGTAPNRTLEVDWNNVNIGGGGSTSATALASYKLRLYETTNVIEFIYGPTMGAAGALSASVGLAGASSFLSVTPGATSTTSNSVANDAIAATTNLVGKKYRFTPPSCLSPTGITASAITTTTATASWTAVSPTPTGYEYVVSTTATAPTGAGTATTAISIPLTSLTPATTYYIWVRSNCSGSFGAWNSSSFITLCVAVNLPWTENFDTLALGDQIFPSCWASSNTSGVWNIETTPVAYSGANSLGRTWSTDGWAFTPLATLTAGVSYTFSYYMRTVDAIVGYDVTIGAGTTQNAAGMTTTLNTVTGYQGTTWTLFEHVFTPTVSGNYSMGIHVVAPSAPNGINFDDFKLDVSPSCLNPTAVIASAVTTSTATISWTASPSAPANGYEYYYSTTNTAPTLATIPSGVTAAGVLTANLTTLSPATTYFAWVRSVCSGTSLSAWSPRGTFTTPCVGISTINENFDGVTTPALPTCWTKILRGTSLSTFATVTTAVNTTNSAPNSVSLYNSSSVSTTSDIILVSPFLSNLGAGTHRLKFYAKVAGAIQIGTLDNNSPTAVFTPFQSVTTTATSTLYTIDFSTYTGSDTYIGFKHNSTTTFVTMYIDDVVWEPIPSCNNPTAVTASTITTSTATISWTAPSAVPANGYEYYYATTNTAPTLSTIPSGATAAGTVTASLTTLSSATVYYVWVRSVCSGTDISAWSPSGTFTTPCVAVTSFTENFETTTGALFPTCWARVGTGGNAYTQASTGIAGARNMYIYGTSATSRGVVAMIPVSNAGAGTHRLKFKARANFTIGGIIEVGYLTNPADDTTFTLVAGQSFTTTSITVADNFTAILGTTPGTNEVLAFRHTGVPANSVLIDDVVWEPIPSCNNPTAVTASAVTTTTATISWTAPTTAPANGYEYYYATTNTAPTIATIPSGATAAGIVTTNLTTLSSATTYFVWVRSVCSGTDISAWSLSGTFTTQCVAATLPWSENFDTLAVGDQIFPSCWASSNTLSVWNIETTPVAYSGANSLGRTWSTDGWAFTPLVTLTAGNSYKFSYYMRTVDAVVGYDVTIGAGTAQNATAMTNTLSTVTGYQGPTWTLMEHVFAPSVTGDYSFGIHVVAPVAPNGINFDDFKVQTTLATDSFDNKYFSAVPNPVKDVLNLSYNKDISNIAIYNLLGQEMISKAINASQTQIDMSNLATGTYLVKVTADSQVKTIKIVKE
jgi:hypothetical protein